MMDLSQHMRELANDVGNDYSLHAPDDAANLIGKARRGRMVWTSGMGAVAAAGAATLAFGAPAVASVITGDAQMEPAGPATESASVTPLPSVPSAPEPSPEASPEPSPEPSPSTAQPSSPGTIDLTGGTTRGDDDDDDEYEDHDDDDDEYEDHDDDDDDDDDDHDDDDDDDDDDGDDD